MKIVIPDDYQDMVDRLSCFSLLAGHDVVRYREPAADLINWWNACVRPRWSSRFASG